LPIKDLKTNIFLRCIFFVSLHRVMSITLQKRQEKITENGERLTRIKAFQPPFNRVFLPLLPRYFLFTGTIIADF